MIFKLAFLLLLTLCLVSCKEAANEAELLNEGWQFSEAGDNKWMPAKVPGTVQTDLIKLGKIPNPFILNNEDSIQWVSKNNWNYKKSFSVSEATLKKTKHFLKFDGLDTYTNVFLNDSLILSANNAFRSWEIDVSDALQLKNELLIQFQSQDLIEEAKASKINYTLPEAPRVFTRKPQFQYGWDWGPAIKTMGIWRDISLISYNKARIKDSFIRIDSLGKERAKLTAILELEVPEYEQCTIEIINNTTNERETFAAEIYGMDGVFEYPIIINNPNLWWTHNLGTPFLYDFTINLLKESSVIATQHEKVGLRTIELISQKDSIGESFYFKLNGKPVYMKGANYIPQNIFLPEVTSQQREKLLDDVVESNMNMLRVWGGGVYEDEHFYNLCDEKGILIWQDFMFACAMYPGNPEFLENAKQEAIENVKRLRRHPSLALWCGNNENSEGWHRWGWKEGKTEAQKQEIWEGYYALFNHILPRVVDSLNPSVSYWESSPKYGRGDKRYQFEGDAHDWWVWHDGYPFEHYEEEVPRFMSEFGFQSFPSYEAIRYFTTLDSLYLNDPAVAAHQKHLRGFQLIKDYMSRDFPVPENDEDYVYVSQLLQAYGITKGIRAHRRAKPYNMGSLYWQLNDCWPAVSWSSIDGLGNWKALQYKVKDVFKNRLIVPFEDNNSLKVVVIDDSNITMKANMYVLFKDFNGVILHKTQNKEVSTSNEKNELVYEVLLSEIEFNRNASYVEVIFGNEKEVYFFGKPKNLSLKQARIEKKIVKNKTGYLLTLSSKTLQKDLFLITGDTGRFEDNFFDLLPNESKSVQFTTENNSPPIVQIKTLNQLLYK